MTKRPRRPDLVPAGGGAFLSSPILRLPNGRFAGRAIIPLADSSNETPAAAPVETIPPAASEIIKPARAASPAQLVARVTRAIERELVQIEDIVGGGAMSATRRRSEAEKRARTLASLARTLAEVTRLRAAASEPKAKDDDDAVPRDLDEFRRTLARRLEQILEEPSRPADRADESG